MVHAATFQVIIGAATELGGSFRTNSLEWAFQCVLYIHQLSHWSGWVHTCAISRITNSLYGSAYVEVPVSAATAVPLAPIRLCARSWVLDGREWRREKRNFTVHLLGGRQCVPELPYCGNREP